MSASYYTDMLYICAFCAGGLLFAIGPFAIVHLLAARRTRNTINKTGQFIECGMEPIGEGVFYGGPRILYGFAPSSTMDHPA